ncbi:MAG: hypothetical protein LPK14_07740 [Hymenobacteraceae bacterium]|nr:hypothetical protein [Hymenobacteraceae bacterium]
MGRGLYLAGNAPSVLHMALPWPFLMALLPDEALQVELPEHEGHKAPDAGGL